ncbi:hypothetical protein A9Q88_05315 [Gammaproteobacteria bacterium 50_400_T64]|nr:hypothetical protein A9Q88_05315 [Gammaproteobacteria bacterium 50_400_T64]
MKTLDLLSCPEATLTTELKQMKARELERHTRKLLAKLGLRDYDDVMATVIKTIAKLDADKTDRFSTLQSLIHSLLPTIEKNRPEHNALIERLSLIMMLLVAKQFHKIHTVHD